MTEADAVRSSLQGSIEALTTSSTNVDSLNTVLTKVGADLNQLKSHVEEALNLAITGLANARDGMFLGSAAVKGSSDLEISYAMGVLDRANTDLQDMVIGLSRMRIETEDMQNGPYRGASEERPRILGKIEAAIVRLRAYLQTL